MITSRAIEEIIELGDRQLTISATAAWDEDGEPVATNLCLQYEHYFNGDIGRMLDQLIDTLMVMKAALELSPDQVPVSP